jgi:hypothetical protein
MSAATNQSELRLARLIDERDVVRTLHENLIAAIESTDDKTPSDSQREQITMYREKAETLDTEIGELTDTVERERTAIETSKTVRRVLAGNSEGVEIDGDGLVYNDFATYARDEILARTSQECSKIAILAGGEEIVMQARERLQLLKRTPANTLSSNVGGLTPAQHIDQIFQVINKSAPSSRRRPVDARAWAAHLSEGRPAAPIVSVQASEKTEAGNQSMHVVDADRDRQHVSRRRRPVVAGDQLVDAGRAAAVVRPRRGRLRAEDGAGRRAGAPAFRVLVQHQLDAGASSTFAQWMTAIGAGYSDVFTNSGRTRTRCTWRPTCSGTCSG